MSIVQKHWAVHCICFSRRCHPLPSPSSPLPLLPSPPSIHPPPFLFIYSITLLSYNTPFMTYHFKTSHSYKPLVLPPSPVFHYPTLSIPSPSPGPPPRLSPIPSLSSPPCFIVKNHYGLWKIWYHIKSLIVSYGCL